MSYPSEKEKTNFKKTNTKFVHTIFFKEKIIEWYIDNTLFMAILLFAIINDYIVSVIVHTWYKKNFSFKTNSLEFLKKLGSCILVFALLEMFREIFQDMEVIYISMKPLIRVTVFLYPTGSALRNLSIITNDKFPPIGWIKKINNFQKTGNIKEFQTNDEENNNNQTS